MPLTRAPLKETGSPTRAAPHVPERKFERLMALPPEPSLEAVQAAIITLRKMLRADTLVGDIPGVALHRAIRAAWAAMVRVETQGPSPVTNLTVRLNATTRPSRAVNLLATLNK